MSYRLAAYGTIAISPPLAWREIKDSPFLPNEYDSADEQSDLALIVTATERESDDGVVHVREAAVVEQRYEDEPRNRSIQANLQQLIDAFPGHDFTGRFEMEGEEQGDQWRLKVVGRKAVRFDPMITWPEGSE
jgi:hypothetical protein